MVADLPGLRQLLDANSELAPLEIFAGQPTLERGEEDCAFGQAWRAITKGPLELLDRSCRDR